MQVTAFSYTVVLVFVHADDYTSHVCPDRKQILVGCYLGTVALVLMSITVHRAVLPSSFSVVWSEIRYKCNDIGDVLKYARRSNR